MKDTTWAPCLNGQAPEDVIMKPVKAAEEKHFPRVECTGASDDRFRVEKKQFTQQFAALYFMRLKLIRRVVEKRLQDVISDSCPFHEKTPAIVKGQRCCLVGTIYKDMKLKPCILDEYSEDVNVEESMKRDTYMSEGDSVVLEDEYGRLVLSGDCLDVPGLVTGVVAGIVGEEVDNGVFEVSHIIFPGVPSQPPIPASTGDRFALVVSGLAFGEESHNPLPTQMLADYITGHLGGAQDAEACSRVERVIIAGDSLHREQQKEQHDFKQNRKQQSAVVAPLKDLDCMLTQLAASVQVDLLPGASDPANFSIPQQRMHKCLFPSSNTFSTFTTHTNPSFIDANGTSLLVSSGQTIDDLAKYCKAASRVDYLQKTLEWRNIAPTAPDTLGCYPFQDTDPFVLTDGQCPHVYIVGNQPEFETKLVEGSGAQKVRLLALPSFAKTGMVALVNLKDLSVTPMCFKPPSL